MGFVMALVCVTVEGRCGTSEELEGSTLHMCRGLGVGLEVVMRAIFQSTSLDTTAGVLNG